MRRVAMVVLLAAFSAAMLAGCGSTSSSPTTPSVAPSAAIAAWSNRGGLNHLKAVSTDLTALGKASAASDIAGMTKDCTALQADARAAQAAEKIPDAQAEADWAAALAQSVSASTDCTAATRNKDAALLSQSSRELGDSTTSLTKVNSRLRALAG